MIREQLNDRVPQHALSYCCQLWQEEPFAFKLTKKRHSKLGDYRFDPRKKSHTVTVNHDLNPYQFLITYVHEVAHRRVHLKNRKSKPHGAPWKQEFQRLMLPLLNPDVFPEDILRPLAKHMKNPKASTASDPILTLTLRKFDLQKTALTLAELEPQDEFLIRRRSFRYLEKKRTRALCLDLGNSKRYLIPLMAEIERL